jgi:hypothetical protein
MRLAAACLAGFAVLATTGCTRLVVESEPSGAAVLWSRDGLSDWRPWPPDERAQVAPTTPLRSTGFYQDTVWVTVEKEGYYRPLPRTVQLFPVRREKVSFELAERPETIAARRLAEGYVLYGGEWVLPAERGLVEFQGQWYPQEQAFRLAQAAKGLVEHEGEWVTPAVRDERFAAAQLAKGLVEFKGLWVTPEERDRMVAMDAEVEAIAAGEHRPMDLPRVVGIQSAIVQADLLNATSTPLRWLLSGPETAEFTTPAYDSYRLAEGKFLVLQAGRYRVAAVPVRGSAGRTAEGEHLPGFAEVFMAEGFQYQFSYDGGLGLSLGTLEDYEVIETPLPADIPTIEVPDVQIPETRPGQGGPPRGGGGRGGGGR